MSYLDMLRQRRAEQDSLGRLLASVGGGLAESMTQQRTEAQQRAKILQEQGQAAARAGQYDIAARAIPQFQEALRAGYDIQPLIAPPVGAPIFEPIIGEAPRPTPSFIGPMPLGQVGKREVGRTFEMPQTKAQIRAGLMMEPPKMLEVGSALLDPETRQWLVSPTAQTPQSRMELLQQRLESSRALNEERIRSAEERASAQRALAMTLAGMRIGSQRELANMRQQPMMSQRAANAFENFISQVPGAIASDIVTMPSGKQGFAVQMPLAVNEQEVARRAALQGFSVTRDQSGNFLLEPTNLMAPRMRAQRQPQLTPVVAEGGGREWGVKRPGVPIPAPTPRPTAAPTIKGRAQEQEAVGRGWKQYLALKDPKLYEMAYGKGMNSNPMLAMRDPQFARLRAQYNREVGIEDEDVGDLSIPTRPGQAPGAESGMQKWMRLLEEEERRRQKGK